MNSTTIRKTVGSLVTAAVATVGLATTTTLATAPQAVATAPSGVSCEAASRLFQLRGGGTEIWVASVADADSSTPKIYSWRKAYTIPGAKGLSLTAHADGEKGIQLLLSDSSGALRSLNYLKSDGKVTSSQTLAKSGYRFTSMASDGRKVWATSGGKLQVMSSISTTKAPGARRTVSGISGLWPQAFYANGQGTYDFAWTSSDGTLRYVDVVVDSRGWRVKSTQQVATGWGSKAITSPGGGVVLRSSSTNLSRQVIDASSPRVVGTSTIAKSLRTTNTSPMTTVPDTCTKKAVVESSVGAQIASAAAAELGTREGTAANKYLNWMAGWGSARTSSTPWCAAFTSWVLNKRLGKSAFQSAAVATWVDAAKNKRHGLTIVTTPKPGDFIAFDWGGGSDFGGDGHIGIVRSVNADGTVQTVEGNTSNPAGGGDGVYSKRRPAKRTGSTNVVLMRFNG